MLKCAIHSLVCEAKCEMSFLLFKAFTKPFLKISSPYICRHYQSVEKRPESGRVLITLQWAERMTTPSTGEVTLFPLRFWPLIISVTVILIQVNYCLCFLELF